MPEKSEPKIDGQDLHTVSARAEARRSLEADIEAFLAEGGTIQDVGGEPVSDTRPSQHP